MRHELSPAARRHDLDALRAIAMLLGIGLHAALSFAPFPWPVQDTRQSELFGLFFAAVHGFRMPLFFLLSGFFTAMLWRRRGLREVLWQRFRRVFLPCMAGLFTIVPAVIVTGVLAAITAPASSRPSPMDELFAPNGPGTASQTQGTNPTNRKAATDERTEHADVSLDATQSERPRDQKSREVAGGVKILWGLAMLLMYAPVFHHLWFLWFLCWLVAAFAVFASIADHAQWSGPPKWLVLSPLRFAWLLPLTMIPQAFMGWMFPVFGPDTSMGLIPAPHILLYYAIFFGFGVLYFDCDDTTRRVGRWWPLALPLGLCLVFPLGLDFTVGSFGWRDQIVDPRWHRFLAVTLQVVYAWTMTFGMMGLFRAVLSSESKTMRYLSDSSYWLYLAHLPLIFIAQAVVRSWPLPAALKFALVCGVTTAILLLSYQTFIRYTWVGTCLNGPRKRPSPASEIVVAEIVRS